MESPFFRGRGAPCASTSAFDTVGGAESRTSAIQPWVLKCRRHSELVLQALRAGSRPRGPHACSLRGLHLAWRA
eukprot:6088590-Alexandrium_andersonii.AAC.1